jgi:very-short-patch-repair endonuclease
MSNNYQGSLKHQENARNAFRIAREKLSLKKQKRIEDYNKNPKKCKNCNIVFHYQQRYSTFCSKSCANSFNNKKRTLKESTKEKIRKTLKGRIHETKILSLEHIVKICPICKKEFKTRKKKQIFCSRNCARKNNGSCESAREKISKRVQERLQNGTFSGWKSRKDKNPSYPEQYFIDLFNNENIKEWERDYKVGRWFIDFAFINKKLALEIDGKQHKERKEQDKIKDNYLQKNGWNIFRIKWFNPINEKNKENLYKQIEELKQIYLLEGKSKHIA